jgi:hypothetical protein
MHSETIKTAWQEKSRDFGLYKMLMNSNTAGQIPLCFHVFNQIRVKSPAGPAAFIMFPYLQYRREKKSQLAQQLTLLYVSIFTEQKSDDEKQAGLSVSIIFLCIFS